VSVSPVRSNRFFRELAEQVELTPDVNIVPSAIEPPPPGASGLILLSLNYGGRPAVPLVWAGHRGKILIAAGMLVLLGLAVPIMTEAPRNGSSNSLQPCPSSPNCVSSLASDETHRIEPFRFSGSAEEAWKSLGLVLRDLPRITIVEESGGYLHAEARSRIFRFVDDVDFMLDYEESVIQVRSASRVGHSDLGVNRRRVEQIRSVLLATAAFGGA
jgi:uncharacterized protein (DUF1499 family)